MEKQEEKKTKKTTKSTKKATPRKKKLPTTKHVLIKDVTIGDTLKKEGQTVELTKQGVDFFRDEKYIN